MLLYSIENKITKSYEIYFIQYYSSNNRDLHVQPHIKNTPTLHLNKRREENQLDATEMLYCPYNLLNMFWALVRQSSEARDYTFLFAPYGV